MPTDLSVGDTALSAAREGSAVVPRGQQARGRLLADKERKLAQMRLRNVDERVRELTAILDSTRAEWRKEELRKELTAVWEQATSDLHLLDGVWPLKAKLFEAIHGYPITVVNARDVR